MFNPLMSRHDVTTWYCFSIRSEKGKQFIKDWMNEDIQNFRRYCMFLECDDKLFIKQDVIYDIKTSESGFALEAIKISCKLPINIIQDYTDFIKEGGLWIPLCKDERIN